MRQFQAVDAAAFVKLVRDFPWTRSIVEVHLHHTWRPRKADYKGLASIEAMWRFHTQENHWSDIAQHATIAPDGQIWIGRNFNWAPASARGFNGNSKAGPFMIEMIGDFDKGRDALDARQKAAALTVIAAVQKRFGLDPSKLRFHNEMSPKSCPGGSQVKADWIGEIANWKLPDPAEGASRSAFPGQGNGSYQTIAGMDPLAPQTDDTANADHPVEFPGAAAAARGLSGDAVDPAVLEALSDHVVNLTQGAFSRDGIVRSDEGDVDRIFDQRIEEEIRSAQADGRKAHLLLWAHGGLVDERSALLGAYDQLRFWQANGVYPLFFIWETGLAETLKQMLGGTRDLAAAPRGVISTWMDDRVEDTVRFFGADKIWSGMKRSAELACGPGGGASYVAQKVDKLLKARGDAIDVSLVGHSAGSIFHTRLLGAFAKETPIKTAHFLAPAVTSELFLSHFAPKVGNQVSDLTIFTMTKPRELADTVTPLYHKSLLYMIYGALEPRRDTDILGLEVSLRRDVRLRTLLGLGGQPSTTARVVWSPSGDEATGSASNSASHGGFDNDPITLQSVCRRITDKMRGEPIVPYRPSRSPRSIWETDSGLPEHLRPYLGGGSTGGVLPTLDQVRPDAESSETSAPEGRRLALCFGIDEYPHISQLECCRKDVSRWAGELRSIGFDVQVIDQAEATSDVIVTRLRSFIASAGNGDRLVVQYSGHGTLFTDTSGDEESGNDSAICAWDCGNDQGVGGLVFDDDIYEAAKLLPAGAKLTFFFDCCHSGTLTRALAAPPQVWTRGDRRMRFVKPTEAMKAACKAAHASRAAKAGSEVGAARTVGSQGLVSVQFSACQDEQVAYESDGSGDFTRIVVPLLKSARQLTNRAFLNAIVEGFGAAPLQKPNLDCDPGEDDRLTAL